MGKKRKTRAKANSSSSRTLASGAASAGYPATTSYSFVAGPDHRLAPKKTAKTYGKVNKRREQQRLTGRLRKYKHSQDSEKTLAEAEAAGKGVKVVTPFGNVRVTFNQTTRQMMVSSRKDTFDGSESSRFMHYQRWADVLDGHSDPALVARHILSQMETPVEEATTTGDQAETSADQPELKTLKYTKNQERAAAMLMTTISTAEEYRVDGARKLGRAALRFIADGSGSFKYVFGGLAPIFTMAASGGTANMRAIIDGDVEATAGERQLLSYVSDSDSEEEYDPADDLEEAAEILDQLKKT